MLAKYFVVFILESLRQIIQGFRIGNIYGFDRFPEKLLLRTRHNAPIMQVRNLPCTQSQRVGQNLLRVLTQ